MPFMSGKDLKIAYDKAKSEKWAFVASNIAEPNVLVGLINGASETNSDLLLQISAGAAKYAGNNNPLTGFRVLSNYIKQLAKDSPIGIAVNIDHAQYKDIDILKTIIREEMVSSVMIDASKEDYETNVKYTKEVVELAHQKGILVEAELGKILGQEDEITSDVEVYTDPDEALDFVQKTGVDLLAIAIGTNHGVSKGKDMKLRIDIAEKIDETLKKAGKSIPLVLHGASGLLESQVRDAIDNGVCKVNKDTRYQHDFAIAACEFYSKHTDEIIKPEEADDSWSPVKKVFDPRVVGKVIRKRISESIIELMKQTKSNGKSIYK